MNSILLMFHVGQDAGYAIKPLYSVFFEMAKRLVGDSNKVHASFCKLSGKGTRGSSPDDSNVIEFDPSSNDSAQHAFIRKYVARNGIDVVFGFDQPVRQTTYRHLRKAGVRTIVSYQGAPMSSLHTGLLLKLKQLEVLLSPGSPDHYVFESRAMAETAWGGRGISKNDISIVNLGVDTDRFRPGSDGNAYVYSAFSIPLDRRVIYYSGHMSERKGIAVLVRAAMYLHDGGRDDFHFLLLGNRQGEEQRYLDMLADSLARDHVTFGGYRDDVERLLPCCYAGVIASTGWDSFTMSSLEIAACGLPLLVSDLQGLSETIAAGETGYLFRPGDHVELAGHITGLLEDVEKRNMMGEKARQRIVADFTRRQQISRLVAVMQSVTGDSDICVG